MLLKSVMYPMFTTLELIGALQPLAMLPDATIEFVSAEKGPATTDISLVL